MLYSLRIQKAVKFAAKTHQVYQDQKRRGKMIPYIIHPLTVGMILALAGAEEEVVAAGILHDTIEDSPSEKKVTKEMLTERFGEKVANLVDAVTEKNRWRSWDERKKEAVEHIAHFSKEGLLVKSADIISNSTELIDDWLRCGDSAFSHFMESKEKTVQHYLEAIEAVQKAWLENPLLEDLEATKKELQKILI